MYEALLMKNTPNSMCYMIDPYMKITKLRRQLRFNICCFINHALNKIYITLAQRIFLLCDSYEALL
jgi:hypothetical protein